MNSHAAGRQPSRRLVRKYALVIAVLVSGALLVSGVLQSFFSYEESSSALGELQREKAAVAAARISAFLQETEHQIASTIQLSGATDEEREGEYLRLLRLAPAVTDVRYVNRDGREQLLVSRVSLNERHSGADFSDSPSFREVQVGLTYFSPVSYRDGTEPYMALSIAENTPLGGVTIAEVNLKFIWDVVSQIRPDGHGYAYVVDGTGQLIAHNDISRVLRRSDYSPLVQVQRARLEQPIPEGSASGNAAAAFVAANADGQLVLSAHQQIATPGWWVFVEQPIGEAFTPLIASVFRTAALLLAGLGLSVVGSLVLARRMVRPIQALESGAALIGAGHLDHRIDVQTGDELETLADAFNRMAAQLASSYGGLEQKVAERTQELVGALHELELVGQHKSEFVANMSHELRTPLNAVIGFSEMMLHELVGPVNDKQREYLDDVLISGRHLLSLINDMLDLSKIDAGKMTLDSGVVDMPEILEHAVSLMRPAAIRGGLSLALSVEPDPPFIEADERKIRQVVLNLLSNAVKFTPAGGRIDVKARLGEGELRVSVQDTGVGLSPEDQLRIFDAFQQGRQPSNQRLTRPEGTGLGLTLAKRFVELHGGRLSLQSGIGTGSTFTFSLPVPGARTRRDSDVIGSGPTILLVEDDPQVEELLSLHLRQAGFSVATTSDGGDVLRLARQLHPIAIVLDILLHNSELDGWGVLSRLKGEADTLEIPVVIVSVVDERGKGMLLGAAEYVVKPFVKQDLLAAFGRLGLGLTPTPTPAEILIVDDDPLALEWIARAVTSAGYRVNKATTGYDALRSARRSPPALIVLDLMLPDLDGFGVVQELRSQEATAGLPIVILTAKSLEPEDKQRLIRSVTFLAEKSEIDRETLVKLVRKLCPVGVG